MEVCTLHLGTQTFTLCVGRATQAWATYFLKVLVGAFDVERVENQTKSHCQPKRGARTLALTIN